ncbi:hypothetical protein J2T60_001304 [Natronospira proteinivora]|uniref:ABC-type amino acid transport substrate-binding protein n=1 Tax=Natronospira proteinivora TaxID=1807133 RepID=A0ABT1G7Q2_9GAMM|nr:transporter substrate-binding domain-containing protein [Natronospira proteinivora]MCP1727339.1 hypothetical protein [Natronospira proteinivora]
MLDGKLLGSIVMGLALLVGGRSEAEPTTIGYIKPDAAGDERDAYFLDVLELALEKTEEDFGEYQLQEAPLRMNQSRAMREMLAGRHIDVLWSMTDPDRESRLRPIRVPLLKGLLGIRLPLVRQKEVDMMASVSRLSDLKGFSPGQGHDWPDTRILQGNDIAVETSASYEGLFRMLEKGRVDYIPRAVVEIGAEQDLYERFNLVPGTGPLIAYPAPIYFFVAPDNRALAERLELGLQRAIETNAFQSLFETYPAHSMAIEQYLSGDRPIIWLDNPFLPEQTPLDDEALWFEPVFRYRTMLHKRSSGKERD